MTAKSCFFSFLKSKLTKQGDNKMCAWFRQTVGVIWDSRGLTRQIRQLTFSAMTEGVKFTCEATGSLRSRLPSGNADEVTVSDRFLLHVGYLPSKGFIFLPAGILQPTRDPQSEGRSNDAWLAMKAIRKAWSQKLQDTSQRTKWKNNNMNSSIILWSPLKTCHLTSRDEAGSRKGK